MAEATKLFFPLRTSVELFRDAETPAAHVRAKQGALLFDELVFEQGIYDITMAGGGAWSTVRSADTLDDDALRTARVIHETGEEMTISVGVQPARGVPAPPNAMRPIIQGAITRHYVAEWESVLRQLAEYEPDWAKGIGFDDQALSRAPEGREIRQLDFACMTNSELMADENSTLRKWTYESFNRDSVLAKSLGATVSVTSRFWPLLDRADMSEFNAGDHALECFVPNLEAAPWESVIEFRNHPGAREARERLRDFEQRALDGDPGSLAEFQLKLGQEITHDFQQAWKDMKPSVGAEIFRQGVSTVISTAMPIVGPASGVMGAAYQSRKRKRSWRAALMKLSE